MNDFAIAPELYELAINWPTYTDVTVRPGRFTVADITPAPGCAVLITRCAACEEEIFPAVDDELDNVVRHLLTSHGYRMDGRCFDHNREITNA